MRYYSDVCNKLFDSKEELDKAETALANKQDEEAKKKAERKADADKVQAAYDKVCADYKEYTKVFNDFLSKYGSYHHTTSKKLNISDFFDELSLLKDFFMF